MYVEICYIEKIVQQIREGKDGLFNRYWGNGSET